MNEKANPFKKGNMTVELSEEQAKFKRIVNQRKTELRRKYMDFRKLKVTVTGAGDKTLRLSFNIGGLSEKGVTNANFYLDWDDKFLEELVPQVYEILGITEKDDEEAPSFSLEALMGE